MAVAQTSKIEFIVGNLGIGLALLAISLSYLLSATADIPNKLMSSIDGIIILILSIVILFFPEKLRQFKKNEFIHTIILKIEEKLLTRT